MKYTMSRNNDFMIWQLKTFLTFMIKYPMNTHGVDLIWSLFIIMEGIRGKHKHPKNLRWERITIFGKQF